MSNTDLVPLFRLVSPAARGERFKLVITHPLDNASSSVPPLSSLAFRISSPSRMRLLGALAYRDLVLTAGQSVTLEVGPADVTASDLSIVIEDIAWSVYARVATAPPIALTAPNALPAAAQGLTTTSIAGAKALVPLEPGRPGSVDSWISWALETEPSVSFGSAPLIMISFAQHDQQWAGRMEKQLNVGLQRRPDARTGQYGSVWSYRDDIRSGDHIHHKIVRAMCEARAAVVFLSPDYFSSRYCHAFELPFLLWRKVVHDLDVRFVRVTHMADPAPFVVPGKDGKPITVDISSFADDRVATPLGNSARLSTIEDLIQQPAEVDRRFSRIAQELIELVLPPK